MIPPSDSHKPRQLLRPKLPFQETSVQADPPSPMADSAQQNVLWQQPPVSGSYHDQAHEQPASPTPAFLLGNSQAPSWPPTSGSTLSGSSGQAPLSGQQSAPLFDPGKQSSSQLQPFTTGAPKSSQFQPFAAGKPKSSQFQSFVINKPATPSYPVTDKQEAPFFQPYETGQQSTPPFQPFFSGSAPISTPSPAFGRPGNPPFSAPITDHQQTPRYPTGGLNQQLSSLPPSAFNSQNMLAVPGYPNISTDQQHVPQMPMPGFPQAMPNQQQYASAPWPTANTGAPAVVMPNQQQYTSAAWPTTSTGSRPVPAYARTSSRHTAVPTEPRKPLKEPKRPKQPEQPGQSKKGRPVIATAVVLVLVAAIVLVSQRDWLLAQTSRLTGTQLASQANSAPLAPGINTITNNKEISPFLFGTNMALFHDNDEPILNSVATRQQLKNIGVRIIRMPWRTTLKLQTEITAAEDIKQIGASALVVMNGPEFKDAPLYESDQKIISTVTGIFGKQPVYFEFGNESDLNGINVNQYILKWNEVIPLLKKQFPTARFIALDNYQFDRRYTKTFLQHANPLPDGISWHEYTCSVTWSAQFCLKNIDTWPIHFAQARAAMMEAIGKELPIWISEWNYTSDQAVINGQPINDGKYNDPTFMHEWTTKAMQTLIDNRIFASMQYFATNPPMALVNKDQIQTEGQIFQQNYKTIMVDGKTPSASYYKVPPPVVDANAQYSFETPGSSGWQAFGPGITQPMNTTAKALNGTHSLVFTLANNSQDDTPFITVNGSSMASTPKGGQLISAYLYVANPKALVNAKIFVADPSHAWHFANSVTLTPGAWNEIWYSLPLNFSNHVAQLGMQFFTSTPGVSSDVYLDQVEWK